MVGKFERSEMGGLSDRYRRWFEYEQDVHRKTLASLQAVSQDQRQNEDYRKAVDLFAHILAARLMWLYRFGISKKSAELFPTGVDLDKIPTLLEAMEAMWTSYLGQLTDDELARSFEYQASDGNRFRSSIEDILTQLFGHSCYHRGQIAQLVRRVGGEPAITDFVFWSREAL